MRVNASQHLQHRSAIPERFAHADDASTAQRHTGTTHPLKRFKPLLIGAGGDDPVVMLRAGVEVVVVSRQPRFSQAFSLVVGEHPSGHAGFQAQLPHAADHLQHRLKRRPLADLPPGPTHAETIGSSIGSSPCAIEHGFHFQVRLAGDITAVMHRLRAVSAVLLTATGLHAQQRGQLDPVTGIGSAMHTLGTPEQVHQGERQEVFDLLQAPVMA